MRESASSSRTNTLPPFVVSKCREATRVSSGAAPAPTSVADRMTSVPVAASTFSAPAARTLLIPPAVAVRSTSFADSTNESAMFWPADSATDPSVPPPSTARTIAATSIVMFAEASIVSAPPPVRTFALTRTSPPVASMSSIPAPLASTTASMTTEASEETVKVPVVLSMRASTSTLPPSAATVTAPLPTVFTPAPDDATVMAPASVVISMLPVPAAV